MSTEAPEGTIFVESDRTPFQTWTLRSTYVPEPSETPSQSPRPRRTTHFPVTTYWDQPTEEPASTLLSLSLEENETLTEISKPPTRTSLVNSFGKSEELELTGSEYMMIGSEEKDGLTVVIISSFCLFAFVLILLFAMLIYEEKRYWEKQVMWQSRTERTETESNEVRVEAKALGLETEGNVEKIASERFLSQPSSIVQEGNERPNASEGNDFRAFWDN
jgi:hypothetical protein